MLTCPPLELPLTGGQWDKFVLTSLERRATVNEQVQRQTSQYNVITHVTTTTATIMSRNVTIISIAAIVVNVPGI